MLYPDPTFILLALAAFAYLGILLVVIRTGRLKEYSIRLLLAFNLLSLAWTVIQGLLRLQQLNNIQGFDIFALERLRVYGLVGVTVLFFHLTRAFQGKQNSAWLWWVVGVIFLSAGIVLYENFFRLAEQFVILNSPVLSRWLIAFTILVIGWAVYLFSSVWMTLGLYRRSTTPLHRNRNKYWSAAVILAVVGQSLVLSQNILFGNLLQLLACLAVTYATLTFHLPDVRLAVRKMTSYLIMTLLTVALYTGGFYAAQLFFQTSQGYSPILIGIVLSVAIAILFNPLLEVVKRFVDRLISGGRLDVHHALSEYSMSISSVLDLEKLASVVVSVISDVMETTSGALVTITQEPDTEDGKPGSIIFRPISGTGQVQPDIRLAGDGPVVAYLQREHRPLTQYEIDLLPRFKSMDPAERECLSALKMDVYVPVYAKDQWRGVLALGAKASRDIYFDEDLSLLQTLADQTAVALENARLYDDLKQRNSENERLNLELHEANDQLSRLDKAKTDFINIASHELRTPLTQIIGYNDMVGEMIRDNSLEPSAGISMTESVRKAARRLEEIVETMFEVTKLDTRTLELMSSPVSVASFVTTAIDKWNKGIEERKQTISVRGLANLPTIMADGRRMTQVFSHLIQNAVKNTPDGGAIRITGRVIEDPGKDGGPMKQMIEVVVADTGTGINAEDLERIFEKFYRVGSVLLHSTGSTKFKGAGPGLGLTIARGIVEAHGGRIWAESSGYDEENCPGSRFHVLLPVNYIENQAAPQPENGSVREMVH